MPVNWKRVYVFISSTFHDMHAERDYLVKRVFPSLRDWCERRKLRLVDVDLRWGVTEVDATANQNVVKTCLKRIDECRPFFLCFLGQRRGWCPGLQNLSPDTLELFPGLEQSVRAGASVTELEILHAIISPFHRGNVEDSVERFQPAQHAFFYLRNPSYLDELPADPPLLRQLYADEPETDSSLRTGPLDVALDLVSSAHRPIREYTAKWNPRLSTSELCLPLHCPALLHENVERWRAEWKRILGRDVPGRDVPLDLMKSANEFNRRLSTGRLSEFRYQGESLGDVILSDLKRAISDRYPDHTEESVTDDLQRELDEHEEFLFVNSAGFIERIGDFADLDRYARGESSEVYVLTGPGGMGKSMLLANWLDRRRVQSEGLEDTTYHFRFAGQSGGSTGIDDLLYSILCELQRIAGKIPADTEISRDPIKVRKAWREALKALSQQGRTVIVIDGINQLPNGLRDVSWIPLRGLPKNVRLIVSFRIEQDDEEAQKLAEKLSRNGHVHLANVRPFRDAEDRRRLVDAYLLEYLKELDDPLVEDLIALRGAENPLFLKIVLSELRVFGAYAQLSEKIRQDFGTTPVSAFGAVLLRLRTDPAYAAIESTDAVPLLFGLLGHARRGLSVMELCDLFSMALEDDVASRAGEDGIRDTITLLLRQVQPYMARRNGRYDFFYESVLEAVRIAYVGSDSSYQRSSEAWHGLLADYFQSQGLGNRRTLEELPYHLRAAERLDECAETLVTPEFIERKAIDTSIHELLADSVALLDQSTPGAHPWVLDLVTLIRRRSRAFLTSPKSLLPAFWRQTSHSVLPGIAERQAKMEGYLRTRVWIERHDEAIGPRTSLASTGIERMTFDATEDTMIIVTKGGEAFDVELAHFTVMPTATLGERPLAVSPSNKCLTAHEERLSLWDLTTCRRIMVLNLHEEPPEFARFLSEVDLAFTWNWSGGHLAIPAGGRGFVSEGVKFTGKAEFRLWLIDGGDLKVGWDMDFEGHDVLRSFEPHPQGQFALLGTATGNLMRISATTPLAEDVIAISDSAITAISVDSPAQVAVVGTEDGQLFQCDLKTGESSPVGDLGQGAITMLEHNPVGQTFVAVTDRGLITQLEQDTGHVVWTKELASKICGVCMNPETPLLAVWNDETAWVLDAVTGDQKGLVEFHSGSTEDQDAQSVERAFFNNDGSEVVVSAHGSFRIETVEDAPEILASHSEVPVDCARYRGGEFEFLSFPKGGYGPKVHYWTFSEGEKFVFENESFLTRLVVAFGPGPHFCTLGTDVLNYYDGKKGDTEIWDLRTGKRRNAYLCHDEVSHDRTICVDDATEYVLSGNKHEVALLDTRQDIVRPLVNIAPRVVSALALSKDGDTVAIGCEDGCILLVAGDGKPRQVELMGHYDRVSHLEYLMGDCWCGLVSTADDGYIRCWDVTNLECLDAVHVGEPVISLHVRNDGKIQSVTKSGKHIELMVMVPH